MGILDNEGHDPNGLGNRPIERAPDESVTAFTMRRIRAEIVEECAACVPTTWLDPLLSTPLNDEKQIERMLQAVAERIRSLAHTGGD